MMGDETQIARGDGNTGGVYKEFRIGSRKWTDSPWPCCYVMLEMKSGKVIVEYKVRLDRR